MPDKKDNAVNSSHVLPKQAGPSKDMDEQLMLYISENERLVREARNLKHSVLNMMHGISSYIELEDWDGLKKYFYAMLENIKNITDSNLSSINKIENTALKGLLSSKLKNAAGAGVNFILLAEQNILVEEALINEVDLCQVIGTFIDNAIEAASEASTKRVSVYFIKNSGSTDIIIENTFKEKANLSLIETRHSSEGKSRVLGLQSANSILSKYPYILNNTFIQHKVFVQELQIIK